MTAATATVSDTAVVGRPPGVSPHAHAHAAAAAAEPKMMTKDAVVSIHSISPTLYVKGLTYQHILTVDMFTKEQVCNMFLTPTRSLCRRLLDVPGL